MIMRTFSVLIVTVACTVFAARVDAQTLDEWILPPGIMELDVDASLGTPVALVQGATGVIDRFDPSTSMLTHWTVGPAALQFTTPGQIQVHIPIGSAPRPVVFVTDAPHNRIGMLDISGARYRFWDIGIASARTPHALAVDHLTGQVWFTTYDGVNPPAVAMLDPSAGTISSWPLLPPIAGPSDQIDGIVVTRASGALLVYVAIAERNELLEIKYTAVATAQVWPLRYTQPTRIAVDRAGDIFAPNAGSNLVLRCRPSISEETLWFDGSFAFRPYISIDSAGWVFLPSDNGGPAITRLNPLGFTTNLVPTPVITNFSPTLTAANVVPAVRSVIALPMVSPAIVPSFLFPFTNWMVPGNGPLSCDPTAPLIDTWFIHTTATNRIARLRP
jgi:hypothetical protein